MKSVIHKFFAFTFCICILLCSCHDQDYYNVNPNDPSEATPSLILTKVCIDVFNTYPLDPAYASRYLTYYERPTSSVNYGWTTGDFGEYNTLRQVKKMEELATKTNEANYLGLAKFFRAILYSKLTERFGEIPYSQSLQAEEGITKPQYDTQEEIYRGILKELEEANTLLDHSKGAVTGDIIYYGDIAKWKKAVTVFKLRTLIHLSKKENNANLDIKGKFAATINDATKYPLMKDNNDNAQIVFNDIALDNYYPTFNNLSVQSLVSIEKGFADLLIERQDQRLFLVADPILNKPANNFTSYAGVNAGLIISDQQSEARNASKINSRYVNDKINEPIFLLSFSEQEFLIAEAIQRGWISGPGTAASHYNAGVRGSFQFYGLGGMAIESYLGKPMVKFDASKGLEMIAIQKYIAMFCQAGWEPFYEQRRTGIPEFHVGPATLNDGVIPKRWAYPQSEYDNNKEAVEASVLRQFSGVNDVNGKMWILQ